MTSIRSRLLIAAIAVLFTTVVANSQSQTAEAAPPPMHEHGHGYGHGDPMEFFADYLNLTDAQQAQAKSIMEKEHATLKPLFQQVHQAEQQLRQYELGTYDEAKVRALAAQKSQAETELTVQKTRIHSELFQILTPDQQAKMKEFEANREARRAKHMQDAPAAPEQ